MTIQWKILSKWINPIPGRIENMLVHNDLLITHNLQELKFWNIKAGLDKPEFILMLECEDAVNLRVFGDHLYLFAYYAIEIFDLTDVNNVRKLEKIQFDRNLVIGSHSMQSYNHVGRCGALMNDKLVFSFFNGIARMENGIVKMMIEIDYKRFKLEKKDILFHNGHLYVVGRDAGIFNFKVSGDDFKLVQNITKGYTPTSFLLHSDNSTLILIGGADFITIDISNPDKIVRHKSAKTNAELCGQLARYKDQYLSVGWTTSNKIQLASFEIEKDGGKLINKQILKDYLPREESNSDTINGVVVKDSLMLVHTYYRGFGLFEAF